MLDAVNAPKNRAVSAKATSAKTTSARAAVKIPQSGTRRLVRWHLTALSLLAAFSVGGQVVVQSALHAPPSSAAAQAARQETLGQHLVLSALALRASDTPAQRAGWETDLRDTAALWKQSESALPQAGSAAAAKLADAATHQQAMLDAAGNLLAALPPDSSRQKPDLSRYFIPLFQQQKPYNAGMDAAAAEYSREDAAHLAYLRGLQAGLGLLTLLAVASLGLPAALRLGRVGQTITELDAAEEKLGEMDAALSQADRQIAQMRQTLENLSTVDALTGLSNHRAFQEQLDRELGRALRHNQPLSLLLLDVDQFKSYNDSYGHSEGDRALTLISSLLQDTARASDIAARYGGKEFAIILTETDMMGAVVLGERLRQAVASADGLQRPLTASIGITTLTPMVFSAKEFVAQAERALSHAKGDGRNRVAHAHRIAEALEDAAPVYTQAA